MISQPQVVEQANVPNEDDAAMDLKFAGYNPQEFTQLEQLALQELDNIQKEQEESQTAMNTQLQEQYSQLQQN